VTDGPLVLIQSPRGEGESDRNGGFESHHALGRAEGLLYVRVGCAFSLGTVARLQQCGAALPSARRVKDVRRANAIEFARINAMCRERAFALDRTASRAKPGFRYLVGLIYGSRAGARV
jgi:hypothetical protein